MMSLTFNERWAIIHTIIDKMYVEGFEIETDHYRMEIAGMMFECKTIYITDQYTGRLRSIKFEGPDWEFSGTMVNSNFFCSGPYIEGDQDKANGDLYIVLLSGEIGATFPLLDTLNKRDKDRLR